MQQGGPKIICAARWSRNQGDQVPSKGCVMMCGIFLSVAAAVCARSATEKLESEDKFFCDKCRGLQEAQKWMKIKALPRVLCLHLKRFKYIEQLDR